MLLSYFLLALILISYGRYLSFLLAFSHLVNGTGEPTRDGHATFMILSRFLAILRSSSLPAASYPN